MIYKKLHSFSNYDFPTLPFVTVLLALERERLQREEQINPSRKLRKKKGNF